MFANIFLYWTALADLTNQSSGWNVNESRRMNYYCTLLPSFDVEQQKSLLTGTYHECPLLDFVHDNSASLGHPGQQHSDSSDRQPADIQTTGCCVKLMDL